MCQRRESQPGKQTHTRDYELRCLGARWVMWMKEVLNWRSDPIHYVPTGMQVFQEKLNGGAWVVQAIKRLTLGFSSGHDFTAL